MSTGLFFQPALILPSLNLALPRLTLRFPGTYFSMANSILAEKSRTVNGGLKALTLRRIRASCGQPTPFVRLLARTYVKISYLKFDGLGTTSKWDFPMFARIWMPVFCPTCLPFLPTLLYCIFPAKTHATIEDSRGI